jgi:carbon-monoxide dehydrogenase medium subunit
MRDFEFLEPTTLAQALSLVQELGDDCRVAAGATALLLAMRQRILNPQALVSLSKIEELRRISFDPRGGLTIGALARHAEVANSPLVREHYPVLAHMASRLANPQVRNRGSIGGNLCYADPATDPPGCLLAHDASVTVASARGERVLALNEFLVDYYTTALQADEILTTIRVPAPAPDRVGRYARHLRTAAEHRPLANITFLAHNRAGLCTDSRLTVGAAVPVPQRLRRAEDALNGRAVTLELAAQVAQIVAQDIEPISDSRGEAPFRREIVRVMARRCIAATFGLDGQESAQRSHA